MTSPEPKTCLRVPNFKPCLQTLTWHRRKCLDALKWSYDKVLIRLFYQSIAAWTKWEYTKQRLHRHQR